MYNFSLTKKELSMIANGLDNSVRVLCSQIVQNVNAGTALKELLPKLIEIDNGFRKFQEILNNKEEIKQ